MDISLIISAVLALFIVAALVILHMTRQKLKDMDGMGEVTEPDQDQDDVIGYFGKS